MGRDIHIVLEKKTADGWEFFDPGFAAYDGRNYAFFEFLEEISEAGCPPELNGRKLRLYSEKSNAGDGKECIFEYHIWDATVPRCMYGFGYVTLEKLVYEAEQYRVAWVSAEFVEAFLKLGGVFPAGMQVATRKMNDGAVGIRVFDEDELRLRDYIYAGIDELRSIADEYGLKHDELRICFAFDC